jgi:hypothetical protein
MSVRLKIGRPVQRPEKSLIATTKAPCSAHG